MMMTQSYYGGDFDSFSRPGHRAPTAAHYDRPAPYSHGYYDSPHHTLHSEYVGRQGTRTMISEPGPENGPTGHSRRRIQVACSRCRRRKIKCTGDPGDGSGCTACRAAGADRTACTFIRVGSQPMSISNVDVMSPSNAVAAATPTNASYTADASSANYDGSICQTHHRPSLPMLQTRTAYPEYDSYNTSPVDDYTYASSIPRQQSFSSNYNAENFRPWTSGSVSAPVTSSVYYESGTPFSFGSLQAAPGFPPPPMARLPSVTGEAFSPLNMSSLHSSLPAQTAQERRLPVPYPQSYQQPSYSSGEVPQIRPLGTFSEPQQRVHINGIYTRNGMPWNLDSGSGHASSRSASINHLHSAHHGHPITSSESSSMASGTMLGYQFSASSGSPETSPVSGPALSDSYHSTCGSSTGSSASMMPPLSNMRYPTGSTHGSLPALGGHEEHQRPSSSHETGTSLYSFSTGVDTSDRSSSDRHSQNSSSDESQLTATPQHNYPPIQHPRPQHAASVDELRRRSSYDQRAATAHRMSVSNLNGHY